MFANNQRQLLFIVGAGASVLLISAAAVLLLDTRSAVQTGGPQVEAAFSQAIENVVPLRQPGIDDGGLSLPRGVNLRGQLQRGQSVGGSVGMYHMEGWSLDGKAGEQYLLDFEQLEGGYYWQMAVYDPQRNLLAFTTDSEAGYADFTQLRVDIPADGLYVVVLSGFGESAGEYALAVY
jgi:hypothetical protein